MQAFALEVMMAKEELVSSVAIIQIAILILDCKKSKNSEGTGLCEVKRNAATFT